MECTNNDESLKVLRSHSSIVQLQNKGRRNIHVVLAIYLTRNKLCVCVYVCMYVCMSVTLKK